MYSVSRGIRGPKIKIKKSVFIATAIPITSTNDALLAIDRIKKEFSKATHNAWAWRIYPDKYDFNDDGELKGTAGNIIYNILVRENIFNTILIVTRFYGGIHLGRGGLIRAYSGAALDLIKNCELALIDK